MNACIRLCVTEVDNWIYKDPEGENPHKKLHYATFLAIIKAGGGVFFSRAGGQNKVYDWNEGLAHLFKSQICATWVKAFHTDLPLLEGPMRKEIDDRWDMRINNIISILKKAFPKQKAYLDSKVPSLMMIKEQVKDQAGRALQDVAVTSDDVHKELAADIKSKWKPTYKRAAEPKIKGKGTMQRRHTILKTFARNKDNKTYKEAVAKMKKRVSEEISRFPNKLETVWVIGVAKLKAEVTLILDKIVEYEKLGVGDSMEDDEVDVSEESTKAKIALQEKIRPMLYKWYLAWNVSPDDANMHDAEDPDQDESTQPYWKKGSEIPTTFKMRCLKSEDDEEEDDDMMDDDSYGGFGGFPGWIGGDVKVKEEVIDSDSD